MSELRVGIMGAGNISATYFRLAPLFKGFVITAVADINAEAARVAAETYGVEAMDPEQMLASDDIDLIVNLTVPSAHAAISLKALEAGKHVYSEKPFVLSLDEGRKVSALAAKQSLRVGSAPDTFLGGAQQQVRAMIDDGEIGPVHSGTAYLMSAGLESWHPNPDFFYQPGGGPILDMGPYYLTSLVNILGPVSRVAAVGLRPRHERLITAEPRQGETIPVDVDTTVQMLLVFESGATVTFMTSWDVHAHRHSQIELYGRDGTLVLPDPNFFGGTVELAKAGGALEPVGAWAHPLGVPNGDDNGEMKANYRTAGLADMVRAIREGGDFACDQSRALHVVDTLFSIQKASDSGQWVTLETRCERPPAFGIDEASALMKP